MLLNCAVHVLSESHVNGLFPRGVTGRLGDELWQSRSISVEVDARLGVMTARMLQGQRQAAECISKSARCRLDGSKIALIARALHQIRDCLHARQHADRMFIHDGCKSGAT